MLDLVPSAVIAIFTAIALRMATSTLTPSERAIAWASLFMHGVGVLAQVWITVEFYRGGDLVHYHRAGAAIVRWMEVDPSSAYAETLALLALQPTHFPFRVTGAGSTTGAMTAISALIQSVIGPSIYGMCLAVAALSLAGKVALYRFLRENLPSTSHTHAMAACLAMPSVVFWTSALLKESFAVAGLGFVILGCWRLVQRRPIRGVAGLTLGTPLIVISKAYVLFSLLIAMAVWLYWRRATARSGGASIEIRPIALVSGAILAWLGVNALGYLFPRYSIETFAEQSAHLQEIGAGITAGSNYDQTVAGDRTLTGQLLGAPFALFTALFRPLIFEARNAPLFISALETTALAYLSFRALARHGLRGTVDAVKSSPLLVLAATFVITFGIGVGLTSTNLGTLSRYRTPMMPLFATLVLALAIPTRQPRATVAWSPARPPPRMRARAASVLP